MVKKVQKSSSSKKSTTRGTPLAGAIKDSAQQIWLAGLGAFSKAQDEGEKAFETLVKEGLSIQRKTQAVAEERISEATSRVTHMATDISSRAAGKWDKLENIFEERVAKAMSKLGVPSAKDVDALVKRVDQLNRAVEALSGKPVAPAKAAARKTSKPKKVAAKAPAKKAAKPVARKSATRKAAARKATTPATPAAAA